MKVLVTGATGYTGSCLAKELLVRGNEVFAYARSQRNTAELSKLGVQFRWGDLGDPRAVDQAVQGMDVVYHIAASYRESGATKQTYRTVNVDSVQYLIDSCRRHGVKRMVHCSTVGVHGHIENPPANEDAPFAPDDEYQVTKLEGEQIFQKALKEGFPGVVFRPVGIHGPGDTRFLKLFKSVKKGTFVMFGSGDILYHLTYIDDLVNGIIACGEHPAALGRTYIIAGPEATTLQGLVDRIAHVFDVKPPRIKIPFWCLWIASVMCETVCKPLGINPPLYRRRAEFFRKDRSFDSSRIKKELGVVPKISLDEGLRRTAAWYREKGLI